MTKASPKLFAMNATRWLSGEMSARSPKWLVMVQVESLLLCGAGGLIGALGPYVAFTWTPLKNFKVPLINTLEVHPVVCLEAIGIALLVGLLAAIWPSYAAARLRVVDALRALE